MISLQTSCTRAWILAHLAQVERGKPHSPKGNPPNAAPKAPPGALRREVVRRGFAHLMRWHPADQNFPVGHQKNHHEPNKRWTSGTTTSVVQYLQLSEKNAGGSEENHPSGQAVQRLRPRAPGDLRGGGVVREDVARLGPNLRWGRGQ